MFISAAVRKNFFPNMTEQPPAVSPTEASTNETEIGAPGAAWTISPKQVHDSVTILSQFVLQMADVRELVYKQWAKDAEQDLEVARKLELHQQRLDWLTNVADEGHYVRREEKEATPATPQWKLLEPYPGRCFVCMVNTTSSIAFFNASCQCVTCGGPLCQSHFSVLGTKPACRRADLCRQRSLLINRLSSTLILLCQHPNCNQGRAYHLCFQCNKKVCAVHSILSQSVHGGPSVYGPRLCYDCYNKK